MDIGSIFLFIAVLLLVVFFISKPFLQSNAHNISSEEVEYSSLLAERDRIINALQELDFDFSLGKIPEGIYPSQRTAMLEKGAYILKKIDEYLGDSGIGDIDSRLEAAIDSRHTDSAEIDGKTINDEELEEMIANHLRRRQGKTNGFCPQCGTPMQQSDRFCSKCGHQHA